MKNIGLKPCKFIALTTSQSWTFRCRITGLCGRLKMRDKWHVSKAMFVLIYKHEMFCDIMHVCVSLSIYGVCIRPTRKGTRQI